jgi:hypothetical protein
LREKRIMILPRYLLYLCKCSMMRILGLILVFSAVSFTTTAQVFQLKITSKNCRFLNNLKPAIRQNLQTQSLISATSRLHGQKQITPPALAHSVRHSNMPCIIPDLKNVAPIPNALPYFRIPGLAAIPNPLIKKTEHLLRSSQND